MGGSQIPKGHLPLREVTEKEVQEGDRVDGMGGIGGTPRVGLAPLLTILRQYKGISRKQGWKPHETGSQSGTEGKKLLPKGKPRRALLKRSGLLTPVCCQT